MSEKLGKAGNWVAPARLEQEAGAIAQGHWLVAEGSCKDLGSLLPLCAHAPDTSDQWLGRDRRNSINTTTIPVLAFAKALRRDMLGCASRGRRVAVRSVQHAVVPCCTSPATVREERSATARLYSTRVLSLIVECRPDMTLTKIPVPGLPHVDLGLTSTSIGRTG